MFCSYCGKKLPEGARFCSYCGSKVALSVEMTEEFDEPAVQMPQQTEPEVIVDEAAVARAEAKATAAVPPESRELPKTHSAAPVRTRIAFDWSNVKDEPQKKRILNVKSPWDETGGFDEEALYREMTPSTDRSRTMNFIDVLKAEKEEEQKSKTQSFVADEEIEKETNEAEKPPRLHFAPLYEDFDTPVRTPFDAPEQADQTGELEQAEPAVKPEEPKAESPVDTAPVREEAPAEKASWHWFEMPDFLKSGKQDAGEAGENVETRQEPAAKDVAEFRFQTPGSALFEEPKYEDADTPAAPETDYPETDYSEYESYGEHADYSEYEKPAAPAAGPEPVYEAEPETVYEAEPEPVFEAGPETDEVPAAPAAETDEYGYQTDEPDYSDYMNMDISRPVSEGEPTGRAAYHASEEPEEAKAVEPEPIDASEPEPETADYLALENDLADILAKGEYRSRAGEETEGPAAAEEPVTAETAAEMTADTIDEIDENEFFAEIEATAPKTSGMTIAAPAEQESEIESLKRRLAELTGAPEPVQSNEPEVLTLEEAEPAVTEETVFEAEPEPVFEAEPELVFEAEPEPVLEAGPEPVVVAEPEPVVVAAAEPVVAAEPELITLDDITPTVPGPATTEQPAAEPETDDPVMSFEDELSKFLSGMAEPEEAEPKEVEPIRETEVIEAFEEIEEIEDTAPVAGLTPFSEFEENEAAAAPEPEVITLDAPEPDEAVRILESIAEPAPAEPVAAAETEPKATDALSLEDLETDLFGETPSPDAEAEVTKKIDKFYTLYRKNEEFQRLLDEEYNKLKTESHPAAVESGRPAAPAVREVEDVTIYQELTAEEQQQLAEAEKARAAQEEVAAAAAAAAAQPIEIKAPPVEWEQIAAEEKAADRKETRKEKKERKKREQEELRARDAAAAAAVSGYDYEDAEQGSAFLTVIAVVIAILLVILLAIILILNFAPDSGIALQIDSIIENITSHFSATDNPGGQYLL